MGARRRPWERRNQVKHEAAPWWAENSKEAYWHDVTSSRPSAFFDLIGDSTGQDMGDLIEVHGNRWLADRFRDRLAAASDAPA